MMNKAKEFLDKIGADNEDVIVLLEEMLEAAFEAGEDKGKYPNEYNTYPNFKKWLNSEK